MQTDPRIDYSMASNTSQCLSGADESPPSTQESHSSSGSSSSGEVSHIGDVELGSASAAAYLESGFIEIDVCVVTATHTKENPSYGPCAASVIVPVDIPYDALKHTCTHAMRRASFGRQWCRRWLRPKDEVISLLNINCWDCTEKLQEMSGVPRMARDCIEVFISGIVKWDQTIDSHSQCQVSLDQVSAGEGQGRIILWPSTYLPPRLPMELQPNPPMVQYEKKALSLCWYWVELNVQGGAIS